MGDNKENIEKMIIQAFKNVTEEFGKLTDEQRTNKYITESLKKKVGEVGIHLGYEVSSSVHDSEWLYDLIWYENNGDNHLEKLVLALESELSDRSFQGLKYDFEKLLVANADFRVFICFNEGNYDYPANVDRLVAFFEAAVSSYKNLPLNSRILVLVWDDWMTGEVHPHLIVK